MPPAATKSKYGQGHGVTVKCEELIDDFTVQGWLLYHHPNFKYCTLFVSGKEFWTDEQTDGRTIQLLDAHGGPFRPGHKNKHTLQIFGLYQAIFLIVQINMFSYLLVNLNFRHLSF